MSSPPLALPLSAFFTHQAPVHPGMPFIAVIHRVMMAQAKKVVLRCPHPPTGAKMHNANGYVDTVWWVSVTVGALAAALGQITHQPANCRRMLALPGLPVSVSRELFHVHFLLRERDHQGFTQDLSSCSDNYIIFSSNKVTMVHYNNTRSCMVYRA